MHNLNTQKCRLQGRFTDVHDSSWQVLCLVSISAMALILPPWISAPLSQAEQSTQLESCQRMVWLPTSQIKTGPTSTDLRLLYLSHSKICELPILGPWSSGAHFAPLMARFTWISSTTLVYSDQINIWSRKCLIVWMHHHVLGSLMRSMLVIILCAWADGQNISVGCCFFSPKTTPPLLIWQSPNLGPLLSTRLITLTSFLLMLLLSLCKLKVASLHPAFCPLTWLEACFAQPSASPDLPSFFFVYRVEILIVWSDFQPRTAILYLFASLLRTCWSLSTKKIDITSEMDLSVAFVMLEL